MHQQEREMHITQCTNNDEPLLCGHTDLHLKHLTCASVISSDSLLWHALKTRENNLSCYTPP